MQAIARTVSIDVIDVTWITEVTTLTIARIVLSSFVVAAMFRTLRQRSF